MADYFAHFSFIIPQIDPNGEEKYVRTQLAEAPNEELDFNWELQVDGDLWIYSEGCSSAESAAGFVQEFLAKFRPEDAIGFEVSLSCSKPRLDAYGGSAVFITATDQEWINTGTWLSTKESEWKKINVKEG